MLALGLVALVLLSGCSLILPTSDELAGGEGAENGSCPGIHGPAMVDVGEYCIDSTEVTALQYSAFLDAKVPAGENPDVGCASGNTSYLPATWPNDAIDDRPVVYVDWCDAVGFCAHAGKRLCGGTGGKQIDSAAYSDPDPAIDEWYGACVNGGATDYPYGNEQVPGACNLDPDAVLDSVKASAGCHGQDKYAGVFDLGGNAEEWVNVCTGGYCRANGGSTGLSNGECSASDSTKLGKSEFGFNRGFRCCADRKP